MPRIPYNTPEDKENFQGMLDNMSPEQLKEYGHTLIQDREGTNPNQFEHNFQANQRTFDTWFDKVMGRK